MVKFVEGVISLRGESGLLENIPGMFVDWSLANRAFAIGPISIPNNCLAVKMLEMMAECYGKPEWAAVAGEMREVIEKTDITQGIFGGGGDGAVYENGVVRRTDCPTEGGMAPELWAGCHGFNADAGALLTQQVLGLGEPHEGTRTIVIAPHPGSLTWAKGTARCKDGMIFMKWLADHEQHILNVTLQLPKGWKADFQWPFDLKAWEIRINQ